MRPTRSRPADAATDPELTLTDLALGLRSLGYRDAGNPEMAEFSAE